MKKGLSSLVFVLFFMAARQAFSQGPMKLDSTFNSIGIATYLATPQDDWDYSMVLQPDGKIVVAGRIQNDVLIVRYNTNGSLDNSFNLDGSALFPIGTGLNNTVRSYTIAIQPDNKLVFAAYNTSSGNVKLIRCNADGSIDNTFGASGVVTEGQLGPNKVPLVVQPDGKIVAAGRYGSTNSIGIIRYNTSGAIDATFGSSGTIVFSSLGTVRDIFLQSNGKIVLTGLKTTGEVLVIRLNADGTADSGFGVNGWVTIDIGSGDDIGNSVKVQTDGKIVIAGVAGSTANSFFLIRLNSDGTPDTGFDLDGKRTYQLGSGANGGNAVAIDSLGKIVVAGYAKNGNSDDFTLIRLNTDGTPDTSFSTTGFFYTDINSGSDDGVTAIAIQPDGKIVAAGYSGPSNDKLVVSRYSESASGSVIVDTCHYTVFDTIYITRVDTIHYAVYDTNYVAVTDTLLINFTVSGSTSPNDAAIIKVFPSPASDRLIVDVGNYQSLSGYKIRIENALGQVVFVTPINQQLYYIDLSGWTGAGTYFVSILNVSSVIVETKQIILQ